MNYIVKARARLDLKSHWRYIARDNLPAADRLLAAAEETFKFIAENPDIGSQRNFRKLVGVRSRAVTGFGNYLVFYQMRGEASVIVRVLHGMRDLPKFF
jgi:toxin ParE1/3/4